MTLHFHARSRLRCCTGDSAPSTNTSSMASAATSSPRVATVPLPMRVAGVKRLRRTTSPFTTVRPMASASPAASARRASAVRPSSRAPRSCGVRTRTRPDESAVPLREEVPLDRVTLTSGFFALFGALEQLHRSGRHHRRDRVLVDQLRMCVAAQQHRKIVEPSDDALQLHAIHEKDRHGHLVLADVIQEHVLYVLGFFSSHRFPLLSSAVIVAQSCWGPDYGPIINAGAEPIRTVTGPRIHRYHNSTPWETRSCATRSANPAQFCTWPSGRADANSSASGGRSRSNTGVHPALTAQTMSMSASPTNQTSAPRSRPLPARAISTGATVGLSVSASCAPTRRRKWPVQPRCAASTRR